jgi:hypothetical protein
MAYGDKFIEPEMSNKSISVFHMILKQNEIDFYKDNKLPTGFEIKNKKLYVTYTYD